MSNKSVDPVVIAAQEQALKELIASAARAAQELFRNTGDTAANSVVNGHLQGALISLDVSMSRRRARLQVPLGPSEVKEVKHGGT